MSLRVYEVECRNCGKIARLNMLDPETIRDLTKFSEEGHIYPHIIYSDIKEAIDFRRKLHEDVRNRKPIYIKDTRGEDPIIDTYTFNTDLNVYTDTRTNTPVHKRILERLSEEARYDLFGAFETWDPDRFLHEIIEGDTKELSHLNAIDIVE